MKKSNSDRKSARRKCGVTSVFRRKTLAQAELSSAEQEKSKRAPGRWDIDWENKVADVFLVHRVNLLLKKSNSNRKSARRKCGVTSVFRRKTLAQAELSSAEQEKSKRAPGRWDIDWENKVADVFLVHRVNLLLKKSNSNRKSARRKCGVTSVFRRKTLAQAEFSSAEQEKSKRAPGRWDIDWEKTLCTIRLIIINRISVDEYSI